ncbi:MAG: efflux RND transporter periplasmic adaptor subunit [Gammaproteobacteria bacterium]|nr:efflux RND transporter periplasmic adaptor subunit [Gammaproteobacteria bacterium]
MNNIREFIRHGLLLSAFISCAAAFAGPAPQMPPASVATSFVERALIVPTVPIAGTIYSRNDVQITIGVDGQLEYVAEPGTVLQKDDVIARIDQTPLLLQKAEQEAAAERARAQLIFLDRQLDRQQNLLTANSTSANQLEQTQSDRDVAASDLRIAELRIQQIDDQLQRATIRAQFNGVIIERLRREGEDVSRGAILARMTDTENLEVRVFAPLRYSGRVTSGDSLRIFGYESEHSGIVRTVVPSADMRSQTFEVRVDLPQEALGEWTVGQLVSVAIPMRSATDSLAVHRDALILRRDGTFVFRISDENIAERIAVEIGDSSGDLVAVEGDLNEGDRVVVRGAETLSPGRQVTIIDSNGDTGSVAAN